MQIKLLEAERYHELPIEANPNTSIVVVVEDDNKKIRAYWMAQLVVHTEPVWIDPELRSGFTGVKMYAALLAALQGLGIKEFYSFADRDEIDNYLQRLGLKITPFSVYRGVVPECPFSQHQPSSVASSEAVAP